LLADHEPDEQQQQPRNNWRQADDTEEHGKDPARRDENQQRGVDSGRDPGDGERLPPGDEQLQDDLLNLFDKALRGRK
jgi:hypothetical protein